MNSIRNYIITIFAVLFTLPALAATSSEYENCVSDIRFQYNLLYDFDEDQDYQKIYNELKQKQDEECEQKLDTPLPGDRKGRCSATGYTYTTYECKKGQTPRECLPEQCWDLECGKINDEFIALHAKEQFINKKIAEECGNTTNNTSGTPSTQSNTVSTTEKDANLETSNNQSETTEKTITGRIISSVTKKPIEFAAVFALGTDKGITADIDGNFSLTVPGSVSQIKISRTGYKTQTFDVPANNNMGDIKLAEADLQIDEVTVTVCTAEKGSNSKSLAYDIVSKKCYPIQCVSDRYKLTNPRSVQSRKDAQEICIGSTGEDGSCEDFCEVTDKCETITIGDACEDQVGKECTSGDTNAKKSKYEWINNELVCVIKTCQKGYLPNDNRSACEKSEGPCTSEQVSAIEHATAGELKKGVCHATDCDDGYNPSDGKCIPISGDCDPMPEHATVAHRKWDETTNTEICIIEKCSGEYRPSDDQRSCIRPTLSEEESQKKIDELQKNADAMKAKEQSTANKLLGGLSIGATGIGGMQLASAVAENRADDAAERDMAAYLATFRCDYGAGRNIAGGEIDVQLPVSATLLQFRQDFFALSTDVKTRKEALGLAPGIESEVVMDSATMGLYDDVSLGRTDGAYTSLSRALSDPTGADAAEWAQQRADTSSQLKTGAIIAGVGAVGGMVGNLIINNKAPKEQSDEIIAKYEPLKKLRDNTAKLPSSETGARCPSGSTGTFPNCRCTNSKYAYNTNSNACEQCPGAKVANTTGNGCECPSGTAPGENNTCNTLSPNVTVQCDQTDPNVTVNTSTGACSCINGYHMVNNKCTCPSNKYEINDQGICVEVKVSMIQSALEKLTVPSQPEPEQLILPAQNLFELGKSDLTQQAQTTIKTFATQVKTTQGSDTNYCITVVGHTDRSGTDKINMPLSQNRAKAVGDALIQAGLPSANIQTSGVGSTECNTPDTKPNESCRKVVISFSPNKCQ